VSLYHYSVTRVRVAACCPRIHYFDAADQRDKKLSKRPMTRIWTEGENTAPGGGKLFHTLAERFNKQAAGSDKIAAAIATAEDPETLRRDLQYFLNKHVVDHNQLRELPVEIQQNLVAALGRYFARVAATLFEARKRGVSPAKAVEQMFGDLRKHVDATLHLGDGSRVHVTGAIDYVYRDPATGKDRIVDYKLTPATHPHKDIVQVMTYALFHHHQHGTEPEAAVLYLHPTEIEFAKTWPEVRHERRKVYTLLASMPGWERYDAKHGAGLQPPGDSVYCSVCKWSTRCEERLGPKNEGQWDDRWRSLSQKAGYDEEPPSTVVRPARVLPDDAPEGPVDESDNVSVPPSSAIDAPVPEPGSPPRTGHLAFAATERSPVPPPVDAARPGSPASNVGGTDRRRIELGRVVGSAQLASLEPSALCTHVAVVGAAGSGKTWMAKVIAEETVAAGVPVVAIDPQGDLVQFLRRRPESEIPADERSRYREFCARVEPRVFTPGSSHATRLCLDPVRLPSTDDLGRIRDPNRRDEERRAIVSSVAANLAALCKAGGEVDSQRTFLYQLLDAMSDHGRVPLARIADAVREPEAFGIEQPDLVIKKAERDKLARKLHGFAHGPSARLFEGGTPLDLDALTRSESPGKVPLNILYLNALTDDDQKHFFVASLAAEIYRWMVTSLDASDARPNVLFYLDEARDFIPAGGKTPPAKEPLIRLFTQGRKYGVGCLICTQSPRSVDYNIFGNCSTKIVGRMEAAQDVERIEQWFEKSGAVPSWVANRKGAERGTFVGRWPEIEPELEGRAFKSRGLFSMHEGAWSPDRLEREAHGAAKEPPT
jgi:hypothetical protein